MTPGGVPGEGAPGVAYQGECAFCEVSGVTPVSRTDSALDAEIRALVRPVRVLQASHIKESALSGR
jgi:hypothetical protein